MCAIHRGSFAACAVRATRSITGTVKWGTLSGSAGIAVVREGRVIDEFTLWVS